MISPRDCFSMFCVSELGNAARYVRLISRQEREAVTQEVLPPPGVARLIEHVAGDGPGRHFCKSCQRMGSSDTVHQGSWLLGTRLKREEDYHTFWEISFNSLLSPSSQYSHSFLQLLVAYSGRKTIIWMVFQMVLASKLFSPLYH